MPLRREHTGPHRRRSAQKEAFLLGVVTTLAHSRLASAEEGAFPTVDPARSGVAPASGDVVLLASGGIVRGTISELLPGDRVVIVSLTGSTQTFRWAEVRYAGAAAGAPAASNAAAAPAPSPPADSSPQAVTDSRDKGGRVRPLVTVHAPEARLELRADTPDVTFHVSTGAAVSDTWNRVSAIGYDRICTAPCEASIAAGTYSLALSLEGDSPVPWRAPVALPAGASTLEGRYRSNGGIRAVGWTLMVAGPAAGLAAILLIKKEDCVGSYCTSQFSPAGLLIGILLTGGGIMGGRLLTMVDDSAEIRVVPGAGGARSEGGTAASPVDAVAGAHVNGRF